MLKHILAVVSSYCVYSIQNHRPTHISHICSFWDVTEVQLLGWQHITSFFFFFALIIHRSSLKSILNLNVLLIFHSWWIIKLIDKINWIILCYELIRWRRRSPIHLSYILWQRIYINSPRHNRKHANDIKWKKQLCEMYVWRCVFTRTNQKSNLICHQSDSSALIFCAYEPDTGTGIIRYWHPSCAHILLCFFNESPSF